MTTEIISLPGGGRGLANFSPSRQCAFALVAPVKENGNTAILVIGNGEVARFAVTYPLHVFITDDCMGVFEDDGKLMCFHPGGILFSIPLPPGIEPVAGFEVTPEGLLVKGGRLMNFLYDMGGRLLNSGRDGDFYLGRGPAYLRWDRYQEAEALLKQGKLAHAKALFLQCVKEFIDAPNHQADILRRLGEISLQLDNKQDAILFWDLALRANPKVGVKKRLEKLKS